MARVASRQVAAASRQQSSQSKLQARDDIGDLLMKPLTTLGQLILQTELDVLYSIQKARRRLPLAIRWLADRLICAHPLYDLSLAVWVSTFVALYYISWGEMWTLTANVLASFLLAGILGGPIPAQLDSRIKPRGRASPSGFPCIELHLATVCLVMCGRAFPHPAVLTAGSFVWILLFALRLYGVTHFPHQLLLSTALGLLSIPVLESFGNRLLPKGMPKQLHVIGMCLVGAVMIGYVAYKAENNDAPVLRVPKAEFERVLGDLMAGDDATVTQRVLAEASEAASDGNRPRRRGKAATPLEPGEAESAWRSGSNSSVAGSASVSAAGYASASGGSSYPPAGPGASSDAGSARRGQLAREMLAGLVRGMGGSARGPPAGPGRSYPPQGPDGMAPGMVIPPASDEAYDPSMYDDDTDEDGTASMLTAAPGSSLVSGGSGPSSSVPSSAGAMVRETQPRAPRLARDSLFFLMRGMEKRAQTKAIQASRRALGLPVGRSGAGDDGPLVGAGTGLSSDASEQGMLGGLASPAAARARPGRSAGGGAARPQSDAAYWGYGEDEDEDE